ncbi:hypothetical protein GEMRC1_004038 [Eukaryota sp. GEM-RC1]
MVPVITMLSQLQKKVLIYQKDNVSFLVEDCVLSRFLILGIYTTPDIEVAEKYAKVFELEGKHYKVVLQNRVNPDPNHLQIISKDKTGLGEYWVSKNNTDVRPYGILIKETAVKN